MFKIGDFSKLNKITVRALRHYDEIGLLKPFYIDKFTGYRYYSSEQLPKLNRIIFLKNIGFSLNEIMMVLEKDLTSEQMAEYLEDKKNDIQKSIEAEQSKILEIELYLKIIKQEAETMKYNIVLKELPEVIVASIRRTIKNYEEFNSLYPEMGRYMEEQKLQCTEPGYCFSLYHDGEYKDSDIDVEICESVTSFGKDTDKMKFKKIAAVPTSACVMHKGPYNTIGMAYGEIMKWIEENGYEIIGLPRESYIDGIWNKPDPNEWLTELQVPIKAK